MRRWKMRCGSACAMSYKNAMADLELGGGKAVIIGDSRTQKTPALFQEAFGRAVEDVGGKYWTAEDVGVSPADLMHARKATRYVAGLTGHPAASGDPSPVTADGVFRGIRLAVRRALNRDLDGVTVAVQGVGHVGAYLCDMLQPAGREAGHHRRQPGRPAQGRGGAHERQDRHAARHLRC